MQFFCLDKNEEMFITNIMLTVDELRTCALM